MVPALSAARSRRAAAAGAVGSVVEWYDYGLFGVASALYIRPLFFAGSSPTLGALLAFATFAVGFAARPLGGIVLGRAGDRWGRRPVLLLTVLLMGISTTLMGLLPTGATLGAGAAVLLVLLRVLQGFGAGAELAGAFVYVTESAPAGRRAFLASFSSAATSVGLLLSTGVFAVLESLLSREAMLGWGWRVPFLLSGLVVLAAVLVRRHLEESEEFRRHVEDAGPGDVAAPGPSATRRVVAGLLAPTVLGVGAYVTSVWAVGAVTSRGLGADVALLGVLLLAATSAMSCVLFGRLADRVGAGRVFLGGAVFSALFAFPFLALLDTGRPAAVVIALVVSYAVGWGACAGAQGAYLPSLFSTGSRFAGVAITRELNSAALAGPAPFVAVALTSAAGGATWPVGWMLVAASLSTLLGVGLARSGAPGQTSRTSRSARSSTTA